METRKSPRIVTTDVINENWLRTRTLPTRNEMAWERPFHSWPIVLAVSIWALSYFTLSQVYTEEPRGIFVFCVVIAICVSAFSLNWRRSHVDKSRRLNQHQQLFLEEYKQVLKKELLKEMSEKERVLLQAQMTDAQALSQITESKFKNNIVGSRVFLDDIKSDPQTKSEGATKKATSDKGRLTSTTPTGV